MILIPIMTLIFLAAHIRSEYRSREPDSYDLWLQEPDEPTLEVVK